MQGGREWVLFGREKERSEGGDGDPATAAGANCDLALALYSISTYTTMSVMIGRNKSVEASAGS